MSSILDSLRKSQQQRREPPPAHNRWFFSGSRTQRTTRRWPLAVMLLAVFAAGALWFFSSSLRQPLTDAVPHLPEATVRSTTELPSRSSERKNSATRQGHEQGLRDQPHAPQQEQPPTTLTPPRPNQIRQALQQQSRRTASADPRGNRAPSTTDQSKNPAPRTAPDIDMPAPIQPQAPLTHDTTQTPPTGAGHDRQTTGEQADNTATHVPASGDQTYRLPHQLPFSIRQKLPQLTLSVHVWDKNPDYRLVVINGEDLGVGDTLDGSDLRIKDILPTGALLETNGEVFLLPRQY